MGDESDRLSDMGADQEAEDALDPKPECEICARPLKWDGKGWWCRKCRQYFN